MVVLIDPPRWPAHGTRWAHLVSDTGLDELHELAARCGIPRRSFDLDHYDVPAERHAEAVAAGAVPVSGRELVRRLIAGGLRVPGVQRPTRRALARRWHELWPDQPRLGEVLAHRWAEPHRHYHGPQHLLDVLERLDRLADGGERVSSEVTLAAWFHDVVHDGATPQDEEASAAAATELLGRHLPVREVAEVARLVRLTAGHDPEARDHAGQVLCDADLGVLGGPPEDYATYVALVRAEYRHVPEADFREGRAAVLGRLLERPRLFSTATGRALWEEPARRNLRREIRELTGGS